MNWVLWRQHRAQVAIAAAAVLAFAVPVLITGRKLTDALNACRSGNTCGGLFDGYQTMTTLVNITVAVPLLIGVFWGATIICRELEAGTTALVWAQSITRRRWLWSKLATLLLFTLASSGSVAALVTWWSNTHNAQVESRFNSLQFDIQGVTPVGYALFASALGFLAGVLWRRTLPTMATTIGGFVVVRIAVENYLRPHFVAPLVRSFPMSASGDDVPSGSFIISKELTLHGRVLSGSITPPTGCARSGTRETMNECLNASGFRFRVTYQPGGRFWSFQWIEFGIFAALAVLLVAAGVVVFRRQDG
ncbi:ABC transporter permease subunit [Jatrophihabitans cynanchi]|jgi:hypothetical protein|uniref:ABC transporter permease subunit n=1 Tax=Jatrophihabitans cynanchi TaxID=2944128 RepID=A0ABY7K2U9_9ACTN|nr:ABC transporter permease subunit [Jatrophihabitans sp. SB3-54]WAX57887.1 ABC transporter permease subunit [Jatrophihabitans sp. SB3-54]